MTIEKQIMETLISRLSDKVEKIEVDYQAWWIICKTIADACGEDGRETFLQLASLYNGLPLEDSDSLYTNALNQRESNITLLPLLDFLEGLGVEITDEEKKALNLTSYTDTLVPHTHTREEKENDIAEADIADNLPYFKKNVKWPKFVDRALGYTDTQEKANAMLLSLLVMVGGMINRLISFLYSSSKYSPCVQFLLIGDSAVGKEVLAVVCNLFSSLQDKALAVYREAMEQYEQDMIEWENAGKNRKNMKKPKLPKKLMALMASDITGPDVKRTTIENNGVITIVSTEIDTWTKSMKQKDWGVGSDFERKAFEHGRQDISRTTNREYMECSESYVTIAMSGTPGQVRPLVPTAEDGQFSRKIYFILPPVEEFKSQFGGQPLKPIFTKWGERLSRVIDKTFSIIGHMDFSLSKKQEKKLVNHFAAHFNKMKEVGKKELIASVLRMPINIIRLMSVLAFIRSFDDILTADSEPEITLDTLLQCPGLAISKDTNSDNRKDGIVARLELSINDADFKAMLLLSDVLLAHAMRVARLLPKNNVAYREPKPNEKFWESLPAKFTRQEALAIAKKVRYAENSMDVALSRECVKGNLHNDGKGNYVFVRAREKKA